MHVLCAHARRTVSVMLTCGEAPDLAICPLLENAIGAAAGLMGALSCIRAYATRR